MKEKRNKGLCIWDFAIPSVLLGVFYAFREETDFAEAVSEGFSMPVREFMSRLTSHFAFSFMEILYVILGVTAVIFIVLAVISVIRSNKKIKTLLSKVFALVLAAAYIWCGYCWLWGIDYYKDGFAVKNGINVKESSVAELAEVTRYFAQNAARLSDDMPRDESGHFVLDRQTVFEESTEIYEAAAEKDFQSLEGTSRKPKSMIFSKIMSYMGFTGIFFPFTGESNINTDTPGALIPNTVAHELAHQRGITAENEANFCGIYACVTSGNTVFEYSGYLSGVIYLGNALYAADREAYYEIAALYTEEMINDLNDNSEYWDKFESKVTEVSEVIYDAYLKSNGTDDGIQSYGECVDLLIAVFGAKI